MRQLLERKIGAFGLGHVAIPLLTVIAALYFTAAQAFTIGLLAAVTVGNPYAARTKLLSTKMLACAIVGLGFGMNLRDVATVSMKGFGFTLCGIVLTYGVGRLLGRLVKADTNTSTLIAVGTGICGGSAIAAVAPVIRARHNEIAVALAVVFALNAIALFLFPVLGMRFELTQEQFGLWAALAIHDTSSVVGAAMQFGDKALAIGTTVKLSRALWIIPVAMVLSWTHRSEVAGKAKRPWFIVGFVLASAMVTLLPSLSATGHLIETGARRLMVVTLFLIGASLTKDSLKAVGLAPWLQGVLLWLLVSAATLIAIMTNIASIDV